MVDLRCPTCISLAMFGEEKSTTHRLLTGAAGGWTPFVIMSFNEEDTQLWLREMLMKPAPATSTYDKYNMFLDKQKKLD